MLKLYLGLHPPAVTEIIAQVYHCMRDVKPSVTWIILIFSGIGIAVYIITVVVSAHGHLTVSAYTQTLGG